MPDNTVMLKRCAECESANEVDDTECGACGGSEFVTMEPAGTELSCDHCGGVAVESDSGLFTEGMADKCLSCDYPGQVKVEGGDAYFSTEQDEWHVRCARSDCAECNEANRDELTYLRELVVSTLPLLDENKPGGKLLFKEILDRYGFMRKPEPDEED